MTQQIRNLNGSLILELPGEQGCLSGVKLRSRQLDGAALSGVVLDFADLSSASLRSACLNHAACSAVSFDGADLSNASLVYTEAIKSSFRNAILSGAVFHGAYLVGADLRGARIDNTDFGSGEAGVWTTDLRGANLSDVHHNKGQPARFRGAKYNDATVFPPWLNPTKEGLKFFK